MIEKRGGRFIPQHLKNSGSFKMLNPSLCEYSLIPKVLAPQLVLVLLLCVAYVTVPAGVRELLE